MCGDAQVGVYDEWGHQTKDYIFFIALHSHEFWLKTKLAPANLSLKNILNIQPTKLWYIDKSHRHFVKLSLRIHLHPKSSMEKEVLLQKCVQLTCSWLRAAGAGLGRAPASAAGRPPRCGHCPSSARWSHSTRPRRRCRRLACDTTDVRLINCMFYKYCNTLKLSYFLAKLSLFMKNIECNLKFQM